MKENKGEHDGQAGVVGQNAIVREVEKAQQMSTITNMKKQMKKCQQLREHSIPNQEFRETHDDFET